MPPAHQAYVTWTPQRLHRWAARIGPNTAKLIDAMIAARVVPQQAYRACLGVLRFSKRYSDKRLEKAATRALVLGCVRYKSIESILKNNRDAMPVTSDDNDLTVAPIEHRNVRGAAYY